MPRTLIRTLFDATNRFKLGRISADDAECCGLINHYGYIGIYDHLGRLVAFVREDDIFDTNGNLFEMDE